MATNDHMRTKEMAEKYQAFRDTGALEKRCPLCNSYPLETFAFWKIIENDFPYDRIAATHHMLVPMRHVDEHGLTEEEKKEMKDIKYSNTQMYNLIVEPTLRNKSIPAHFHQHLIKTRPE